jgi:hypothetical protein
LEAEAVVAYLIGLASVEIGSTTPLDLRLVNPDLRVGAEVIGDTVHVTVGSAPDGAAVIEGRVVDLVDRATGRDAGPLGGDQLGLAALEGFAELLAR